LTAAGRMFGKFHSANVSFEGLSRMRPWTSHGPLTAQTAACDARTGNDVGQRLSATQRQSQGWVAPSDGLWQDVRAGCDVDVVGLRDAAHVRLVRYARVQALQRCVLAVVGSKELERKLSVKRLFGQFGNGLFDINSVHSPPHGLITSIPQPSKSRVLRVTTCIPVARAIAAIWQSASAIGRPAERRPTAISA
jgi:hypothetical protein